MPDILQADTARQTILAIDRGDTLHGLLTLECSPGLRAIPVVNSYLAYCMAKERGQVREALRLCHSALSAEPDNPAHYLNLGRVYLVAQDKAKAIAVFWKGISKDTTAGANAVAEAPARSSREQALILGELRRLGIRKRVPFTSLHRGHPINVVVGKFLSLIGAR
jgi:tetratricopeptide (TPR) repeat protein